MYSINFRLLIWCASIIITGCTTNTYSDKRFMGEGFRTLLPGHQAQVVVGGNRYEAVHQATHWLNNNQFLVVHRWVAEETPEKEPNFTAKHRAQLLFLAHKVKAPFAVIIQVREKPFKQSADFSNIHTQQPKIFVIEVKGLNVKTAEIVFEGKAWNSEPLVESEELVQALTTFALHKAIKDPQATLAIQPAVHQEKNKREHVTIYPLQKNEEISDEPLGSYSSESSSTTSFHKLGGSPHHEHREKDVATLPAMPADENTSNGELQSSRAHTFDQGIPSEDSSLGLQIASGALSVVYLPFKATYAVLGGFFGGLAYVLTAGNETVAHSIWDASWGGTYWLTPQHLRGDQPVYFMGQSDNGKDRLKQTR